MLCFSLYFFQKSLAKQRMIDNCPVSKLFFSGFLHCLSMEVIIGFILENVLKLSPRCRLFLQIAYTNGPDSKVHGANMGPIWGGQDPGGRHVGPMNLTIWELFVSQPCYPWGKRYLFKPKWYHLLTHLCITSIQCSNQNLCILFSSFV